MKKLAGSVRSLLLIFVLTGCSVEIQQTPFLTQTIQNLVSTQPVVSTIIPGNTISPNLKKRQVPITWGNYELMGKLVYVFLEIVNTSINTGVRVLDLESGVVTTIFTAPERGFLYDLAVSPDGEQLLLSYSPPIADAVVGYRGIYIMPLDGSQPPEQLIVPSVKGDENFQVEWSPDGKYIYYTNFNYQAPPQENGVFPLYTIYRILYPDGTPEKIAENALWLRISLDSSQIVYVEYVGSAVHNELYVADADGKNPQEVVLTDSWVPDIKDAPIFMPDRQSILFSGPIPLQAYQPNWLDRLMGVQAARAHNIPSDWYLVPVTGGKPTRLTHIQSVGLFASISPDQNYIASVYGEGIFMMELDGSNLFQLFSDSGAQGTVRWIP